MPSVGEELKSEGYAVIRGFQSPAQTAEIADEVDKMYQAGLKHHATYRDRNLLLEALEDPKAQPRVVLQAHWTAWISPLMERMRPSEANGRAGLSTPLGAEPQLCKYDQLWERRGPFYVEEDWAEEAQAAAAHADQDVIR